MSTKKLNNLIGITNGELLLELEQQKSKLLNSDDPSQHTLAISNLDQEIKNRRKIRTRKQWDIIAKDYSKFAESWLNNNG